MSSIYNLSPRDPESRDEQGDALRVAMNIRIAEMVAESLRDAAEELLNIEKGLVTSNAHVLLRSECIRSAKSLENMADRMDKKIKEGILWT